MKLRTVFRGLERDEKCTGTIVRFGLNVQHLLRSKVIRVADKTKGESDNDYYFVGV